MQRKLLSIVSSIMGSIFLIAVCFIAFVVLSSSLTGGEPTILGYQLKAVLSGSMEPTFQTGSIISIKVGNNHSYYQKDDIITFFIISKVFGKKIMVPFYSFKGRIVEGTKGVRILIKDCLLSIY